MFKSFNIGIYNDNYIVSGDIESLLKDKKIILMAKSLFKAYIQDETLILPIKNINKKNQLYDLIKFFERFGFVTDTSNEVKEKELAFEREQNSFLKFSLKAKKIRNNEFDTEPELLENFKNFKGVLENNMSRQLYPLQLLSSFHMAFSQNSCNFAVPGAGKTSIVYGAYVYLKSLSKDNPKYVDKLLVIGPLSSFAPWENEYKECFNKKADSQRMSGDATISRIEKEQHLYSAKPKEITLISHAGVPLLETEIIDFLKSNKVMVVVDEAHRIKNANGIWGNSVVEISKEAKSRIILTGTPVPNGYEDIFNLYRFLYPFKYKDILQIHYDQLKEMTKNSLSFDDARVKKFIENISPYFIRIKKKDLKDRLPLKITENIVEVEMDEHQKEIYDFIEEKYVKTFQQNSSGTVKDVLNKAKLIRLRQASTNPSLLIKPLQDSLEYFDEEIDPNDKFTDINDLNVDDSSIFRKILSYEQLSIPKKFIKIKNLLEEKIFINNGKAIIWTIFIQNAEQLQKYLNKQNIPSKLLIGKVPQEERERTIEKFNNPENIEFKVIIANPFSVAESISLHKGCHNAIYLERDYNASNFLQSKDRIHRVGLDLDIVTNYYYLISKNSIDTIINKKLDIKVERMEKVIDEEIPLFSRINDSDETDIINGLIEDYVKRTK
ncbi:DEAD/DEAH box helicase [Sulfurimonas sp. CS5]|uniref:DEAD/DEAH box helicase n=1 Tax=Sulfurimonas sp. CS5 TaxID=3391145 RepID=UPI0039EC8920